MAKWAETTVAECSLTHYVWAHFWIGFHTMPAQWHSQPTPTLLGQGCTYVLVYLPPTLLAEWLGSFMCNCGNMGVERTLNISQHTKLTLEKKILSVLLLGFELTTFGSGVWRSYQQVIPASSIALKKLSSASSPGGFCTTLNNVSSLLLPWTVLHFHYCPAVGA